MKGLLLLCCFQVLYCYPQEIVTLSWWNPARHEFPVLEGQGWSTGLQSPFDRLPARAATKVAEDVWRNAKQSAGLMIRFRSSSEQIIVRYKVKNQENLGMRHMPPTGVSGVDLYAIDSDGRELWCAGRTLFADTLTYIFQDLTPHGPYHNLGSEYRLYLPLYNQVEYLEIGYDSLAYFKALPLRMEKPIVVYGTSIAQGACASRPGMAWPAILGRKMDRPVINLGFNGSGRLERPVLELMGELEAKIFILDCLPNLSANSWSRIGIADGESLKKRIIASVLILKEKQPEIPVLLVEHAGYTEEYSSKLRKEAYQQVNQLQQEAYYQLKKNGVQGVYYLRKEEIGLHLDDMVDGTHPSDLGMMHYAQSYEHTLRNILHEPIGLASTTRPCTQYREPQRYDWAERHREILSMNESDPPKTVFLANSIIHFWGGLPQTELAREEDSWEKYFTPMGIRNYAYGWDRIENVLWRVYHGELDGFEAERILLMIGTNNLHLNNDAEIIEGLGLLIEAIRIRQPNAEIMLLALLPRRSQEDRIAKLNFAIARLAGKEGLGFTDLGAVLLQDDHHINESLFSDGLHPNMSGYLKIREAILPVLTK